MINNLGQWEENNDYSTFPQTEWCDMDYMANWIKSIGYEPKTSMKNLINMVLLHYDSCLDDEDKDFYTDITKSENGFGISIADVSCFVEENGGLKEFDYEC